MAYLVSFCAAFAGFATLALAMPKHARAAGFAVARLRAQALRGGGWLLLTLSAAALIAASGWQIGLVEFCAVLTIAGIAVALLLSYRPTWLVRFALAAFMAGIAGCSMLLQGWT